MGIFSAIVSPFFSKVFISINIDASSCFIKVSRLKNKTKTESFFKEFKTINGKIPMDAIKIIRLYHKKYPFTYIAAMLKTLAQGVVFDKNDKRILKDIKSSQYQVIEQNGVEFFAQKAMIKDYLKKYDGIGKIDFLFSPFLLIAHHIQQNPTEGKNLYVLLQRGNIALMIMQNQEISFSGFFLTDSEVEIVSNKDDGMNFELRQFDDFSMNEEFENFSKINFDFSLEHLQTDMFVPNLEEDEKITYNDMSKAPTIVKVILDSLKEYYQNPICKGSFIEKIIFLDACEIADDAFEFISKEVMIESVKRDFNLSQVLIDFARAEIGEK